MLASSVHRRLCFGVSVAVFQRPLCFFSLPRFILLQQEGVDGLRIERKGMSAGLGHTGRAAVQETQRAYVRSLRVRQTAEPGRLGAAAEGAWYGVGERRPEEARPGRARNLIRY